MALSKNDIIKALEEMKIAELNELVKAIEDHFGVVAAAPVAAAANADAGAVGAPSEVNVILTDVGQSKVAIIKLIGQITGKGLMDSKKIAETLPATLKEKVKPEEAEELKKQFVDAGATIELK